MLYEVITEQGGFEATHALLDRSPELTALYVSTFGQAVGALSAAKESGRSVPTDLSIICYDDLPVAAYLDPPLTTIQMPLGALGAAAVDARITSYNVCYTKLLRTGMIIIPTAAAPSARRTFAPT